MIAFASVLMWNVVMAAMLAGMVALLSRTPVLKPRPAVRNVLWLLILAKLITPPLIQIPVLPTDMLTLQSSDDLGTLDATAEDPANATPLELSPAPKTVDALQHERRPGESITRVSERHSSGFAESGTAHAWPITSLVAAGMAVTSITGTTVLIGVVLARTRRIGRIIAQTENNDEQLQQISSALARTLGLSVQVAVCVADANISPMLWARPKQAVIVLPQRLIAQLDHKSISGIIAHELAHWVRQDHWTNVFAFAVAACFWWNPLAWYAYGQLRESQEECCDAMLLAHGTAERRHYAETLLAMLEFQSTPSLAIPAVSPGIGSNHSLRRRFEMLRDRAVDHRLSWLGKAVVASLLILLPSVPTRSEPTDEPIDSIAQQVPEASSASSESNAAISVQELIDAAKPGDAVVLPAGTYTEPVVIDKPLTLQGEDAAKCVFEVTSNLPAIRITGKKRVALESLTIKWQLATSESQPLPPSAVQITDCDAALRDCRLQALGNFKRSPSALQSWGFSKINVENCWFEGFEFTIAVQGGSEGSITDSVVKHPGHCGISVFDGSSIQVIRCIVTGSEYHGIRSTGGKLVVKDNLIIENDNRGVYLGNKSAQGSIVNNVIMGNGSGVSAFAESQVTIANNLFLNSGYSGLDTRDSCRLTIRNNIFQNNPRGFVVYAEAGRNQFTLRKNSFWANGADTENFESLVSVTTVDPRFKDPKQGDFAVQSEELSSVKMGLTSTDFIRDLWKKWQAMADR